MMDSLLLYKILKNRTGAEISASGNPATLTGTLKNNPMNEMKVYGWSKQETTTGKNLLTEHVGNSVNNTWCATSGVNLIAGTTYVFSVGCKCAGLYAVKLGETKASKIVYDVNIMVFTPEETGLYWFKAYKNEAFTTTGQLEIGTEATDYEPYTGGQPSPSPDYPQEIVSAGMKWSTGAQLYDMDTRLNVDGIEYKKNGTSYTVNIVKISGNLLYGAPFQFSKEDVDATLSVSQFFNLEQANVRISLLDSESNIVGTLWADKAKKELSAKCSKIRFDWSKGGKFIVSDLMLNFGNTALPYEPYTDGVPKLYGDKVNVEVCGKKMVAYYSVQDQNPKRSNI